MNSEIHPMHLNQRFQQRVIRPTYGSFRSRVPLRTPSGPQSTESALETETLDQLSFVPEVRDLITQATLDFQAGGRSRRYTVDVAAEIAPPAACSASPLLIEVKLGLDLEKRAELYRDRFAAARAAARALGGVFRVLTEAEVRTPYLANARLLDRHVGILPPPEVLRRIADAVRTGPLAVDSLITLLGRRGITEPDARLHIERAVANRRVRCDLMKAFDDATVIDAPATVPDAATQDPFLATILDSRRGEAIGT